MIMPTGSLCWWNDKNTAHIINDLLPDHNYEDSPTGVEDLNYITYCGKTISHRSNMNFGSPDCEKEKELKICPECKRKQTKEV